MTAPFADADAVLPAQPLDAADPPTLDYSVGATASLHAARPMLRMLNLVAVFSGLCVASCFLVMATDRDEIATVLHLLIFAATLGFAFVGGMRMARLDAPPLRSTVRVVFDLIAGVGLMMVAVAPLLMGRRLFRDWQSGGFIGAAFLLMALTTFRHVLLYRGLARLVAADGYRKSAGWLRTLGWMKFVYEGLWLTCCSAPLVMVLPHGMDREFEDGAIFVALGAFFGCLGFAVIWVMMIVTHTRLVSKSARAAVLPGGHVPGFEVTPLAVPNADRV